MNLPIWTTYRVCYVKQYKFAKMSIEKCTLQVSQWLKIKTKTKCLNLDTISIKKRLRILEAMGHLPIMNLPRWTAYRVCYVKTMQICKKKD